MGLLAPLFLLAGLGIVLPIWLHRLQTQSATRQAFSSTMLLETTEQRVHTQKKLRYLPLLALRIAVLLLLACAFAKPFVQQPQTAVAAAGSRLVLIDTSASMGRRGVMDQARRQARAAIDGAPAGAVVQVLAADRPLRPLRTPSTDRGEHSSVLADLEAGSLRVEFGELMADAARYAQTLPAPVSLHLISDFQASGMPAQFADLVVAGIDRLAAHPVATGDTVNWAINFLRQTATGVEVSVHNQGSSDRGANLELLVNGQRAGTRTVSDEGQSSVAFSDIVWEPGDNRVRVVLDASDDLAADNLRHLVVRNAVPAPVPLLSTDPQGLPVTYLSAALGAATDRPFRGQAFALGEFDARVLSRYRWLIVDDLGTIGARLEEPLRNFVSAGGNLLAFVGERALTLPTLPVSGQPIAPASATGGPGFHTVSRLERQHPALAATDGWRQVNVRRTVALESDGDVQPLVSLDNGEVLIAEQRLGRGRLLLVLSSADNRWNDLPVHPVFVGFILASAEYLSGRNELANLYATGDLLPLALAGTSAGQVVDPDGERLLSLADTAREQLIRLAKPGIYTVYAPEGETLVAANIDSREFDLTPASPALLDRWQDATTVVRDAAGDASLAPVPEPVRLWPWVLLVLAICVIAESAVGNRHIATSARS